MTYGIDYDVPAPIEFYDAVDAEALRRVGSAVDGLLLHVGRPVDGGFRVLELWQSREHWQRYADEVIRPVIAQLGGGQQPPAGSSDGKEFDVRGLIVPSAGIAT